MNPRLAVWTVNGLLAGLAAVALFPLLWMLSVSLMPAGASSVLPAPIFPVAPTLDNYRLLFGSIGMGRYVANSLGLALLAALLSIGFNVAAGYAFAKLRFRGRDRLFQALLAALVIPGQVAMLPLFLMLKPLGLVNTYAGALVPMLASVFGIYLVRQFARGIPDDLIEAARIDGAGEFRIFLTIVVPVLTPVLATLAIFSFLGSWNDFMWPLIVLTDDTLHTLPVALAGLAREHVQDNELMMAGSVVTVLPVLAVFLALQRHYMAGLMAGSVKGVMRLLPVLALLPALHAAAQTRVLDDFTDLAAWQVGATDDVKATLRPATGPRGAGLCIDYDFGRVSGYVTARRTLPIDFPARYEFALDVRGDTPNTFQFKWVDASGENVWWVPRPDFRWPADWQPLKLRQRQIEFAWGPTPDRSLRRTAAVELVIVSGHGALRGTACVGPLTLRELPAVPPPVPPPAASADGLGVDFGVAREFGALALRWRAGAAATRYRIELSDDGVAWRGVRDIDRARGPTQVHWLPDSEARHVRVVPEPGRLAVLDAIEPRDAPSANAYFADLAREAPRGRYPRGHTGEQAYWTVFGVDGGRVASLLGEDGAVEPLPGVGALEPMLVVEGGRVLSWADARITHRLRGGDLPMPAVRWEVDGLALDIDAFARGTPEAAQGLVRYRLRNLGRHPRTVALALAWRPFQVNPPTQFLANPGGASPVADLAWTGAALTVDGTPRVQPLVPPSSVRIEPLAAGPVGDWGAGPVPPDAPRRVVDPAGFASAVLRYDGRLAPGAAREVAVALPLAGDVPPPAPAALPRAARAVERHWRERLSRVALAGPPEVEAIGATLRASLGQILVNRSGPALQPGARAYARSWIRDGALTSAALLRLGQDDVARDFLRWYAPFQFSNGKVPCCATVRGADPVPENDSDGEFIYAVTDHWRHTGDDATARALWPHVRAAAAHMEALRQGERGAANLAPERRAYFGLLPPSISHEGYSDKPAYSYWDDFWAATGWRSAVELATGLGLADDARRLAAQRDEFVADLAASLAESTRRHGLDVLPGSADRGDVDPTSSTIALSPADLQGVLPEPLVRRTFERYWRDFLARRDGGAPWDAYTPYEWRNVGALVRLGERERALAALDFFHRDRRPAGWAQWAEVVGREPRTPRFVGDMPHGWVASDHIRAVLDLFAYEREATQALVLAAGVPLRWLDGPPLRLAALRTPYGRLGWSARSHREGGRRVVEFDLQPLRVQPPGGIELRGPWPDAASVEVDGRPVPGPAGAIRLQAPAKVRIVWPR